MRARIAATLEEALKSEQVARGLAIGGLRHPENHQGLSFTPLREPYLESGLLIENLLRSGFTQESTSAIRPMGKSATAGAGLSIGAIAAFLGVGGSVMTVPLMRRRGARC